MGKKEKMLPINDKKGRKVCHFLLLILILSFLPFIGFYLYEIPFNRNEPSISVAKPNASYNSSIGIDIAANIGDVAVYRMEENGEVYYKKILVEDIYENGTTLVVNLSIYDSPSHTNFSSTPTEVGCEILTGNLNPDILFDPTIVAPILPIGTNFSVQATEVKAAVEAYVDNPDILVDVLPDSTGLGVRVMGSMKYLGVLLDLNLTYSTTGLLLYGEYSIANPESFSVDKGSVVVLSNMTTIAGAEEVESLFMESNLSSTNLAALLGGIGGGLLVAIIGIVYYLRKRKQKKESSRNTESEWGNSSNSS